MAPIKYISAGTQLAFYGLIDSVGFFAGTSGSVSAGLTGESMGRLLGIKTANPGPVEPEDVQITGDDGVVGAINFGPADVPTWIMEIAAFDLTAQALLQGTTVQTLGDLRLGMLQPNDPIYPDICLIYQAKSKSQDSGSKGTKTWSGYIIPVANAVPLGRAEFNERAPAADRFKVTAQVAGKHPWGVTITTTDLGTTGAPIVPFTSDNPITMHRFTGNATTGPYVLSETPISAAKTLVFKDTQLMTPTADYSISVANKTITLVGAAAAGTKLVVVYEFTP